MGKIAPACSVFGTCGGCAYQDLPYEEELRMKEQYFRKLCTDALSLPEDVFEPIIASPKPYHYRTRLDLALLRVRSGQIFVGFQPGKSSFIVEVDRCPIADERLSDFIPQLKKQAVAKLPPDYRRANLTVKVSHDGRVRWGGAGRRSLRLAETDYLWTEFFGKKIFYALDTFFQANHAILPRVFEKMGAWLSWKKDMTFLDLYSGVGLFGILWADRVGEVLLAEEHPASIKLAQFNVAYHRLHHVHIFPGRVEEALPMILEKNFMHVVAMIDPARRGLSTGALGLLARSRVIRTLFYLSCNPETLVRDLAVFQHEGWRISKAAPLDFFPRTRQLEALIKLENKPL